MKLMIEDSESEFRFPKSALILVARVDCNDGVASHIETLVAGLKASGLTVVMVSGPVQWDSGTEFRYLAIRDAVDEWLILEDFRASRPSLKQIRQVTALAKKHAVEIIHAHGLGVLPWSIPVRMLTGLPAIATFHPSAHAAQPSELRRDLGKAKTLSYRSALYLSRTSQVIAYSQEIEDFFRQSVGLRNERISRIRLGIDHRHFRPPIGDERRLARANFGFYESDFVVSLVGRMSWNKGQDVLIDAAAILNRELGESTIKCLFSGSGYQADDIRRYATERLDTGEHFHFNSYTEDLRSIYWASDVFVMPSRNEGFGLASVEAMACGLPVIRTPSGGAKDQILEGENGYLVDFDSPEALASRLKKLRSNPALVKQLAARAISVVAERFTIERMIKDTLSAYAKCLRN